MEEATAYLRDGVLSHLEKLEAHARTLALKQEETQQQQEKLARLRARVQELRLQRDELQTKVNLQQVGLIRQERGTGSNVEPIQAVEARGKALLKWEVENVKSMLQAFHLTGISGKLTKQGVCFCISTAYERTYLDSYYLDLLIQQPVQIRHHSVPIFIPLEEIAKKYLQTDIKRFLAMLSEHLNAYAGRKYQADQLQEHFSAFLEGTLQRNLLQNVLLFNYDVETESKTFPFRAKLVYGDVTRSLPTEAIITCKAGDVSASLLEKTAAHSNLFCHTALHKAFDSFKRAAERLEQTA
nr:centromere protein O isoform X1 [Pelodiscus sinensis]XP_025037277.1 centromere protein O isoform X1 [Pelodiscus sinensis]XP_025037278.1 centromere protein O isoform X1 [Pelodiscus sinensis]|eukprot:XP_006116787.1 centromere protein O isoform X1 [Pelodiscus sinensis]